MTRGKKILLLVVVHIVVWLLFLSLPTLFNPRRAGFSLSEFAADLMEPPRWSNGLLLMVVFYCNYYVAIPKLYLHRKYALLFLSFLVCFGAFFLLNSAMRPDPAHMPPGPQPGMPLPPGWAGGHQPFHASPGMYYLGNSFNLFMFIIVYTVSFGARIYELYQKMKRDMLNTQITFLKAQINPHFLFNTLNSIYSLALIQSDEAPHAVLKLSGMMRYSVSEAGQSYVQLSKELEYIDNYIALQKLRLPPKVKISYTLTGDPIGKQIAPFLIIPFVENAFKYGVNPDDDSDINITLRIVGSAIDLHVINNKVRLRPDDGNTVGLGINTTRMRLSMLYPGRHVLTINDNAVTFNVSLQIQLL